MTASASPLAYLLSSLNPLRLFINTQFDHPLHSSKTVRPVVRSRVVYESPNIALISRKLTMLSPKVKVP